MAQHFLLSAEARTMSPLDIAELTEEQARLKFRALRWPARPGAKAGSPICPRCGHDDPYELPKAEKFRCRDKDCAYDFTITSGTILGSRKLSFKSILLAIYLFANEPKGMSAIKLSHQLRVWYKTAFVLAHKFREAMAIEQEGNVLEGELEIDGSFYGGYVRQPNEKKDWKDLRLAENRSGKRLCVVGIRERGEKGRTRVAVFPNERDSVPWIVDSVDRMASINADEGSGWDVLHGFLKMDRINHSVRFTDKGVCTNQMESLFSRLRRFEVGTHHRIAGPYLYSYASECAWREDRRRVGNGEKTDAILGNVLSAKVSRQWKGYWHRKAKPKAPSAMPGAEAVKALTGDRNFSTEPDGA